MEGRTLCWEVGQDGESLGPVGGGGNNPDDDRTVVHLVDTTTVCPRPALCCLPLIPTIPLGDAVHNSIVLIPH